MTAKHEEKPVMLCIDDELAPRVLVEETFGGDWELHFAVDGDEGVRKFNELCVISSNPKVVIVDLMMPGMDGLEVTESIRDLDSEVLILIWTVAADRKNTVRNALESGADEVIDKQFSSQVNLKKQFEMCIKTSAIRSSQKLKTKLRMEEDSHLIFSILPEPLLQADEAENITWINPAFCRLTGYQMDELLKMSFFNLVSSTDYPKLTSHIAMRTVGEASSYEIQLMTRTGDIKTVAVNGAPMFDKFNKFIGTTAIITDLTELKTREANLVRHGKELQEQIVEKTLALAEEAKLWKTVMNNIPNIFIVVSPDKKVLMSNKAFSNYCGSSNTMGRNACELLHGKKLSHCPFASKGVLEKPAVVEWQLNESTWYEVVLNPVFKEGKLEKVIHIVTDISERKKVSKLMEEAKRVAVSANRTKSAFLANMSHEIRTPMNAIIGFSRLLIEMGLDLSQYDYAQKILQSAEGLLGVINDILDFSKIEAGKLSLECTAFNLENILNDISNLIKSKAQIKGVEILFKVEPDVPLLLEGDPLRIKQILINLVNNAVKFTEKGEVVIKVKFQKRVEQNIFLSFSVRDTGIGMTMDQQLNLFKAFNQADASFTRKYGGTGLGLSICEKLIDMMDGNISVKSKLGSGSTFYFDIKLSAQNITNSELIPEIPADLKSLKVLLVDDNFSARDILSTYLKSFSFRVTSVSTGKSAINELESMSRQDPYKLVLLNWEMPELDGVETARCIRDKLKSSIRIMLMSSFSKSQIEMEKISAGIGLHGLISKPIGQTMLYKTILKGFGKELSKRKNSKIRGGVTHDLSRIADADVLLVEDVKLNQELAVALLKKASINVTIANNGQEAIEILKSNIKPKIELVLMDVQMPVLDGYSATGKIRELMQFKKLPIIAMTAHAMVGEKQRCLDAGMDDYISKPIDPGKLFNKLIKWLPDIKREKMKVPVLEAEPIDSDFDLPVIEGIRLNYGLSRTDGDKNLYIKLLKRFRLDFDGTASEMINWNRENNYFALQQAAHKLKGAAGNIGALSIVSICAEIEYTCQNEKKDTAQLSEKTTELEKKTGDLFVSLDPFIENHNKLISGPKDGPVLDDENLNLKITELVDLIKIYDNNSENLFDELEPSLRLKALSLIRIKLQEFDFEGALAALTSFID